MTIITFDVFFYGLIFLSRCIINDSWPKISLNIKIKLPFAYTFLIPLSFQLFLSSYIRLFLAFCLCNSTLLLTVYLVSNCSQFVHTFFFCRFVLFYSLLLLCSFACLYSTICITCMHEGNLQSRQYILLTQYPYECVFDVSVLDIKYDSQKCHKRYMPLNNLCFFLGTSVSSLQSPSLPLPLLYLFLIRNNLLIQTPFIPSSFTSYDWHDMIRIANLLCCNKLCRMRFSIKRFLHAFVWVCAHVPCHLSCYAFANIYVTSRTTNQTCSNVVAV